MPAFGRKNHVSIDRRHGPIRRFQVTSAAARDGARLQDLVDKGSTAGLVRADAA